MRVRASGSAPRRARRSVGIPWSAVRGDELAELLPQAEISCSRRRSSPSSARGWPRPRGGGSRGDGEDEGQREGGPRAQSAAGVHRRPPWPRWRRGRCRGGTGVASAVLLSSPGTTRTATHRDAAAGEHVGHRHLQRHEGALDADGAGRHVGKLDALLDLHRDLDDGQAGLELLADGPGQLVERAARTVLLEPPSGRRSTWSSAMVGAEGAGVRLDADASRGRPGP